jgi:hypothetical protein
VKKRVRQGICEIKNTTTQIQTKKKKMTHPCRFPVVFLIFYIFYGTFFSCLERSCFGNGGSEKEPQAKENEFDKNTGG